MDLYKRMALFAEVVDAGSLTAAARRTGMTPSAVSQHLRALESALGLALLHRSTRRLTLTEAGSRYFEGCAAMVSAARQADQALARYREEPEGELRIAAPIGMSGLLARALSPLRDHPKLSLTLVVDDAVVDLIEERIDIAVRMGRFTDSSLVARRLGSMPAILCAAPTYLQNKGWPHHPKDLEQHVWLGGRSMAAGSDSLTLTGPNQESVSVKVHARIQATQVTSLQALCVAGWGISLVVTEDDRKSLTDGHLVHVLPEWKLPDFAVYAVTPRRGDQPAKVRHAMALLADYAAKLAA